MKIEVGKCLSLSRSDVEKVITMKRTLEVLDETFRYIGEGKVVRPFRESLVMIPSETEKSFISPHMAWIKPTGALGIKWAGMALRNPSKGLPTGSGVIILNDVETVMPICIMDAGIITAYRTAGHAGIGAKYLARKDSSVIAIMGCGVQGRTHLMAMNELFKIDEVRIHDIKKEAMDKYSKEMGDKLGLKITAYETPREAVKGADVICMCTLERAKPVVMDEWIEPGTHVCGTVAFYDLDAKFSKTADKWAVAWLPVDVGWIEGEYPWTGKILKDDIYGDLGEIVTGRKKGRERDDERTLMTHLGMGPLDIAPAFDVYKLAKERGLGTILKIF